MPKRKGKGGNRASNLVSQAPVTSGRRLPVPRPPALPRGSRTVPEPPPQINNPRSQPKPTPESPNADNIFEQLTGFKRSQVQIVDRDITPGGTTYTYYPNSKLQDANGFPLVVRLRNGDLGVSPDFSSINKRTLEAEGGRRLNALYDAPGRSDAVGGQVTVNSLRKSGYVVRNYEFVTLDGDTVFRVEMEGPSSGGGSEFVDVVIQEGWTKLPQVTISGNLTETPDTPAPPAGPDTSRSDTKGIFYYDKGSLYVRKRF